MRLWVDLEQEPGQRRDDSCRYRERASLSPQRACYRFDESGGNQERTDNVRREGLAGRNQCSSGTEKDDCDSCRP